MRLILHISLLFVSLISVTMISAQDRRSLVILVNDARVSDKEILNHLNRVFDEADFKIDDLHIVDVDTKSNKIAKPEDNALQLWKDEGNEDYPNISKRVKKIITFQTILAAEYKKKKIQACDSTFIVGEIFSKLSDFPISIANPSSRYVKYYATSADDVTLINESNVELSFKGNIINLDSDLFNDENTVSKFRRFIEREFDKSKEKQTVVILYEGATKIEPLKIGFRLNPPRVSIGEPTTVALDLPLYRDELDMDLKSFKLVPSTEWSQSGFQGTLYPKDDTTMYEISVADRYGCSGKTKFKVPIELKAVSTRKSDTSVSSSPKTESTDCDCGDDSELSDVFDELEWNKYKKVSSSEYIVDGYLFFSNQAGGRVYNLITTRNCASSWKLKIYNNSNEMFYSKTYNTEAVTISGILSKPGFEDYFVFKIDLSEEKYADQWCGDCYFKMVIEGFDSNGDACSKHTTPFLILTKCPE
jgi:hypothetical protein